MSGGVDSATVAAYLLEQGYEVIGLTMRLWSGERFSSSQRSSRTCCSTEDVEDARRVAQTLGIAFYVVDLETEFRQAVVEDYLENYAAGRTPNPCVRCNQVLKFEHLLHKAKHLRAAFLATGHYAIRRESATGVQLWRGKDRIKDQSYFLFTVTIEQLHDLRFPLGEMTKEQTRVLAQRYGLHLAHKKESQDLCFVPDGDRVAIMAEQSGKLLQSGPILDREGKVLGQHRGVGCYTIGQRKGLGISAPQPLYVIEIQAQQNRLIVGPESALLRHELIAHEVNWLGDEPLTTLLPVQARIRSMAEAQPALIRAGGAGTVHVRFDQPQRAITPGQACVFYAGERVLGGGWIHE